MTSAAFKLFGNEPSEIHWLKIVVKNGAIIGALNLIILTDGQSDLVDFLLSNACIIFNISFLIIGKSRQTKNSRDVDTQ